jgi:hypothetical protein
MQGKDLLERNRLLLAEADSLGERARAPCQFCGLTGILRLAYRRLQDQSLWEQSLIAAPGH